MNQSLFVGNIGKDAEIRNVNGVNAIGFTIAVNESYKDQNGVKVEKTLWVSCTIWRTSSQSTEIAKYLTKGTKVLVQGEVSVDVYKNQQSVMVPQLRLKVQKVELLSTKNEPAAQTQQAAPVSQVAAGVDEADNDLPF